MKTFSCLFLNLVMTFSSLFSNFVTTCGILDNNRHFKTTFYLQCFCFVCYAVQILSRAVQYAMTFSNGVCVKAIPRTALLLSKIRWQNHSNGDKSKFMKWVCEIWNLGNISRRLWLKEKKSFIAWLIVYYYKIYMPDNCFIRDKYSCIGVKKA